MPSANTSWIAVLDACIETIDACAAHLRAVTTKTKGADVEAMHRMNAFSADCLRGAKVLLGVGLPHQAVIVTRSAYEVGVRMLWASRATEGWKRLRRYYLEEDQRLAKALFEHERVGQQATVAHESRTAVLNSDGSADLAKAPDLAAMTREIAKADLEHKSPDDLEKPEEHYAKFYRIASGIAHGNPEMIAESTAAAAGVHSVAFATYAARAIVLANVHFADKIGLQPWPEEAEQLRYIDELLLKAATSDDAPK